MNAPKSILSLVPSLTELLFHLELDDYISGRTRFCVHPEDKVNRIEIIGGTKNPNLKRIETIAPDLIIANREENRKDDVEHLSALTEVMVTEINTIEDALLTIYEIGERCGVPEKAKKVTGKIQERLENVPDEPPQRVAYLIWKDPWMTVGSDTYIHSVLSHWNLVNVFGNRKRYPATTLTELKTRNPELILLSSEPYPFKEKHKTLLEEQCPDARILLVDGEWFSWYGSRMIPAFKRLNAFRKAIS